MALSPPNITMSNDDVSIDWEAPRMCKSHAATSVAGRRMHMEDRVQFQHLCFPHGPEEETKSFEYYGIFDGHGGHLVAEECRNNMGSIVKDEMVEMWHSGLTWDGVMKKSFKRMDEELAAGDDVPQGMTVGSTAVVVVVGKEVVVVANCGDSRAVLCQNGAILPLSVDHKPDRPDELARIEAAGGVVVNWNGLRVLGVLATSRSIGDRSLRPFVIPVPEVTVHERTRQHEFLILGTDGLWDVVSNDLACRIVRRALFGLHIPRHCKLLDPRLGRTRVALAAYLLVESALRRGSQDNITVVILQFKNGRSRSAVCSS